MMPVVYLFDHVGLGVIIGYPSAVAYSNQTGGTSNLNPTFEGVFVPLRNDCTLDTHELLSPERELFAYFGSKWSGTGATGGIDNEDADFIDGLLKEHNLDHCMTVDRTRLRDSHESWVHVQITADDGSSSLFSGFAPFPRQGVITWTNTD